MRYSAWIAAAAIGVTLLPGCGSGGGTVLGRPVLYPQRPAGPEASVSDRVARPAEREAPARKGASSSAPAPAAAPFGADVYTQATRYGDLFFLSGQIGMDLRTNAFNESASVAEQTRAAMDNIRQVLEANRLTLANLVSVTVYLRSMDDFRAMDDAYESFFRGALPARTVVEVQRLPRNAAVEISAIAGR